jgi:hypothetical protein
MNFKRIILLAVFTLIFSVITASPVLAQVDLPYTSNIIIYDGKTESDIGDLTVNYDGTVTFQIDEAVTDWRLAETYLYVGDVPPVKIRPAKFPNQHEGLGGSLSDIYNINFAAADLNGDGIVYIAAYVGLVKQTVVNLKTGKIKIAYETAWAQGDEFAGKGKNWITFFSSYVLRIG